MKNARFNKSNILAYLETQAARLKREHKFTDKTGYAQVEGKATPVQVDYGRMVAYKHLADDIRYGTLPMVCVQASDRG
jgi:hypothetical protein